MKKRSQLPRSERPEKKALNGQLRRMSERDLLAVILGSGVSGSNVKQVATTLIRKFGEDLLTADAAALCQVRGMGEVKAARLAPAFDLYRKLSDSLPITIRPQRAVSLLSPSRSAPPLIVILTQGPKPSANRPVATGPGILYHAQSSSRLLREAGTMNQPCPARTAQCFARLKLVKPIDLRQRFHEQFEKRLGCYRSGWVLAP